MSSVFSEYARSYVEKGLSVIPVNGKRPVTEEWQALSERSLLDSELTEWEKKFQHSNFGVGLVLGEASGLIALDLDTDKKEILDLFPKSPCVRRGKKGEVRLFKWVPGLENKSPKGCKFDFMVKGRQVVLPPSVHPETNMPYLWTGSVDIDSDDIPEWPLSMMELDIISAKIALILKINAGPILAEGRNNTLKAQVSAGLFAGDKLPEELAQEIYEYDLNNHSPPLFSDPTEPHMGKGKASALAFVYRVKRTIDGAAKSPPITVKISEQIVKKVVEKRDVSKMPEQTESDGIIYDFMNWFREVTPQKIDGIGVGSGIALLSSLIGNRCELHGTRANVFCLNIAGAATGKTQGIELVKHIVSELKLNILGGGTYRSKKAIFDGFITSGGGSRVRLDTLDEIGSMFEHINNERSGIFAKEMLDSWCSVFTASSHSLSGLRQAKKEDSLDIIRNPYCVLLGATTPEGMKKGFHASNISQGLLPRFLVFKDDVVNFNPKKPTFEGFDKLPINYEKLKRLSDLPWEREDPVKSKKTDLGDLKITCGVKLVLAEGVQNYSESMYEERIGKPISRARDSHIHWLVDELGRLDQNITKLAMIHWASRYGAGLCDNFIVSLEDYKWAESMAFWCLDNFKDFFGNLAEEAFGQEDGGLDGKALAKAQGYLKKKFNSGDAISKKDINKIWHNHLTADRVNKIIKSLEEQGLIIKQDTKWIVV